MIIKLMLCCVPMLTGQVKKAEEPIIEPEVVETEELTGEEQEALDEIKSKLSQFLSEDLVEKIVNWAISGGFMSAFLAVYIKYRKFKSISTDQFKDIVKEEIINGLSKCFDEYGDKVINPIKNELSKVIKASDNMMKALVLAQDKTPAGKQALLDLVIENSKDEKVIEVVKEVKEVIEKQAETVAVVQEEVKGEYNPID